MEVILETLVFIYVGAGLAVVNPALYSNIPHKLGLEAIKYWLDKQPSLLKDRFKKEFVLDGIALILKNNSFQFGNRHFSQIKGTCMGSKIGPVYAILTLAYLEETKLYPSIRDAYSERDADYIIKQWKRYIDDSHYFCVSFIVLVPRNIAASLGHFWHYNLMESFSKPVLFCLSKFLSLVCCSLFIFAVFPRFLSYLLVLCCDAIISQ